MDIAGQISGSPPAARLRNQRCVSTGTLCFMYSRLCITRSPMAEGLPLARDPRARVSARQPRSSFAGSHRVRPGESQQEPIHRESSTAQLPRHLSQQPGHSTHPERRSLAHQEDHLDRAGNASALLLPGAPGPSREHPPTAAGSSRVQPSVTP